jgi:hypothetical protein
MIGRTVAERRAAAVLRAQLSLKHALERIEYAENVIKPKLAEIRALEATQHVAIEAGPEDLSADLD